MTLQPFLFSQLETFLQYIRVTRSRSRHTCRNARSILTRFIQFLSSQSHITRPTHINVPVLLAFLDSFQASSYRYSAIHYLRQFLDFMQLPDNPARQIRFPKVNRSQGVKFAVRKYMEG